MMLHKMRTLLFIMTTVLLAEPLVPFILAKNTEPDSILRLGTYRKLASLNPFETNDTFSTPLMELVFNRLVRYDAQGRFEPDLAREWKISEDGKTYTFFLKENVRFHDGAECTAEDVLHSLKLAVDPALRSSSAGPLEIIEKVNVISKYVLEIKLKESFSPFLLALWRVYIVPQHKLSEFSLDLPHFLRNPIGTGPFVFFYQDISGIELKTNSHYFEKKSTLEGVSVRVYDDKDQMWSGFLREELDFFFYLDSKRYLEIKQHPGFHVFRSLSSSGYALIFNLRQPLLRQSQVRDAIAHAINREELREVLENGEGVLMDGPFHPESWAFAPDTTVADYDPAKTRELLVQAGFTADENLMEKDGEKLVLNLLVDPKNEQLFRIAKMIRQQLQESGIGVNFHFFNTYQEFKEIIYQQNKMHVYLTNLNTGPEPDALSRYWGTEEKINISGYSRKEVDDLFKAARSSSSRPQRALLYHEIQKLIRADKPAVFLYYPHVLHAASVHCTNTEELAGSFILFHKLKDVRKEVVNSSKRG